MTWPIPTLGGFWWVNWTFGDVVSSIVLLKIWRTELTLQWANVREHARLCVALTPSFIPRLSRRGPCNSALGFPARFTLALSADTYHSALYFTCPCPRPALWIEGWLLAAHHDECHAWNTQLVLADGKNKGLHFSQNNEVGRKERNCKKMEVVLGAEMPSPWLPHCLFLPPPRACSRGNGPVLAKSGERSFFF